MDPRAIQALAILANLVLLGEVIIDSSEAGQGEEFVVESTSYMVCTVQPVMSLLTC